jgi:hypothetical protein
MQTRKTLTVDLIMSFDTDYDRQYIKRLFGNRKRCTVFEVLNHSGIEIGCRLRLLQFPGFLSGKYWRLYACDCASRALRHEKRVGRKPDPRIYAVIRTSRRFARKQATHTHLDSAVTAARFVLSITPSISASATRSAVACAFDARRAVQAAMWAAAEMYNSPRFEAEQEWQLRRLKFYLEKEHGKC